jgi:hypothetical protein
MTKQSWLPINLSDLLGSMSMRHFKLAAMLALACSLAHTGPADEFFYANVAEPSAKQIVIRPDSIGGHLSEKASMCTVQDPLWCYHSNGFALALPKDGFKSNTWTHRGFRYQLGKTTKLALLGREIEAVEIIQSQDGRKVMRFVFSSELGLIAFQAAGPAAPTFLSEGHCGLGAPESCRK